MADIIIVQRRYSTYNSALFSGDFNRCASGKNQVLRHIAGPTFVLFTGLIIGHLGFTVDREVADFIREFGLFLFIYSIGLQVGPVFLFL